MEDIGNNLRSALGTGLPGILGALAILIVGWLIALIVASIVRRALNRTNVDNRLVNTMTNTGPGQAPPFKVENLVATAVFWLISPYPACGGDHYCVAMRRF